MIALIIKFSLDLSNSIPYLKSVLFESVILAYSLKGNDISKITQKPFLILGRKSCPLKSQEVYY
ncbi:hypothetical protein J5U22_01733 [Saccharolobus shibatae]|uniref:Uncharacterized protein n=1 Tax=Saccharolobus shibatae TaxID=2286 RepID=A0A8F5C192_9CREN|nr:hypothetical protein J5U21_01827 [Saccharolobus shibatae]QXJ35186.1 hypothetical protein J5U22_01733 [Saccharolobus shibatae]